MEKTKDLLVVRKVDKSVYRKFREKALSRKLNVGSALTSAMKDWMSSEEKEAVNPQNILAVVGMIKTGKKVRYSSRVDALLYGLVK